MVEVAPRTSVHGAPLPAKGPAAPALVGAPPAPLPMAPEVAARAIEESIVAVRHETVRRPAEAAEARPLLKRTPPPAPRRLLDLPATARAAIIKAVAGPLKKVRAARQARAVAHRLPEVPRRGRRPPCVPLLAPGRLGGGNVPGVVRAPPGVLALLSVVPLRARRLEGP